MVALKGLFDLQTAEDLLQKLRHDLDRMKKSPLDSCAAFDFFVTAYHMLEWRYPGKSNTRKRAETESNSILLQVCSHLANGSKHFKATAAKHVSVKDATVEPGAFGPSAFDPNAFDAGELRVELDGEAARKFGASIGALELADEALHFWEARVS